MAELQQTEEIKNLWQIKAVGPNSIIELRAIKPDGIITRLFKGKDFNSSDELRLAFEQEALRLNADGYNIYVVMNPINDSFTGQSAKDQDIAYRDLLLIDIDRLGTSKEPASDEELEAARVLADEIATYLKQGGLDDPFWVMSGNGYHLYYILDKVTNSPENTQRIKDFLNDLATEFDNNIVKVDTCVYNASRITKVVGTIARKGIETEERPFRMARFL
jgi:hypothetical protein